MMGIGTVPGLSSGEGRKCCQPPYTTFLASQTMSISGKGKGGGRGGIVKQWNHHILLS